ncbi:MAG: glycosyltransferase [Clostridia bacterium]|nr:glycosyltransferase [Clostridia bacterium]
MSNPKVSIIVPVYNVENYLERCIESLRNQTLENIEIILVDDASSDSSPHICDKAAAEDSRIKVIHKVNEGAGKARNAALKIAKGEYIGFVDSDDFVDPHMFDILSQKMEEYNSDLVMSGVRYIGGKVFENSGECEEKFYFDKDTQFETNEDLKKLRLGIVGSLPDDDEDSKYGMSIWKNLFKHEIIRQNGIYFQSEREMLSEDALFMIDYISCIKKATGICEAFYSYCRNGDSISKSFKKDRFEKCLVFVNEAEKRFKEDISPDEYKIYLYRFWQAMCRFICSQEIMHAFDNKIKYSVLKKRLETICTNSLTVEALKSYPIRKLTIKQCLFAYGVKHRMYFLLKCFVMLRR